MDGNRQVSSTTSYTEQWGQTASQTLEFYFPISFPTNACSITSGADDVDSRAQIISNQQGRVLAYDYGGHRWMAVGY